MPEEWEDSITVPIFKGKGDALVCGKYRGIRLLEHGMIWEKVLERRLKSLCNIDEKQFGFQAGKSTIDAIFIVKQLQEKYMEKKKSLTYIFVDLEKAFDRVPRKAIQWALRKQDTGAHHLNGYDFVQELQIKSENYNWDVRKL